MWSLWNQVSGGGGLFAFGHLWVPVPGLGRGGVSGLPQGSQGGLEPSTAPPRTLLSPSACGSQAKLTFGDPSSLGFQQRVLRELFSTVVLVWLLSPETLCSSVHPEGQRMSGVAWVGGGDRSPAAGPGKYFSTETSLSSGPSKGSCLLPGTIIAWGWVGGGRTGEEGTKVTGRAGEQAGIPTRRIPTLAAPYARGNSLANRPSLETGDLLCWKHKTLGKTMSQRRTAEDTLPRK